MEFASKPRHRSVGRYAVLELLIRHNWYVLYNNNLLFNFYIFQFPKHCFRTKQT